jgi:hypothetical protein
MGIAIDWKIDRSLSSHVRVRAIGLRGPNKQSGRDRLPGLSHALPSSTPALPILSHLGSTLCAFSVPSKSTVGRSSRPTTRVIQHLMYSHASHSINHYSNSATPQTSLLPEAITAQQHPQHKHQPPKRLRTPPNTHPTHPSSRAFPFPSRPVSPPARAFRPTLTAPLPPSARASSAAIVRAMAPRKAAHTPQAPKLTLKALRRPSVGMSSDTTAGPTPFPRSSVRACVGTCMCMCMHSCDQATSLQGVRAWASWVVVGWGARCFFSWRRVAA